LLLVAVFLVAVFWPVVLPLRTGSGFMVGVAFLARSFFTRFRAEQVRTSDPGCYLSAGCP
jgi:hypothetical protein